MINDTPICTSMRCGIWHEEILKRGSDINGIFIPGGEKIWMRFMFYSDERRSNSWIFALWKQHLEKPKAKFSIACLNEEAILMEFLFRVSRKYECALCSVGLKWQEIVELQSFLNIIVRSATNIFFCTFDSMEATEYFFKIFNPFTSDHCVRPSLWVSLRMVLRFRDVLFLTSKTVYCVIRIVLCNITREMMTWFDDFSCDIQSQIMDYTILVHTRQMKGQTRDPFFT